MAISDALIHLDNSGVPSLKLLGLMVRLYESPKHREYRVILRDEEIASLPMLDRLEKRYPEFFEFVELPPLLTHGRSPTVGVKLTPHGVKLVKKLIKAFRK